MAGREIGDEFYLLYIYGTVDLTFNPDGTLSGIFDLTLINDQLMVSGAGRSWSGSLGSDSLLNTCAPPTYCPVTGYWIATVPEPSSLALFLPALAGVFWFYRRRMARAVS
jgi:hypothetical protein